MADNANAGCLARRMPFTNGIFRFPKDDAAMRAIIAVFRNLFRTTRTIDVFRHTVSFCLTQSSLFDFF
jgi:hypothetical protein